MLDKKTDSLLRAVAKFAPEGYVVLSLDEIYQALPEKIQGDDKFVSDSINYLKDNDYIDVKYRDKNEICLAVTLKTQAYLGGEKELPQKAKIANGQLGFLLGAVFLASFLGSLAAHLIAALF